MNDDSKYSFNRLNWRNALQVEKELMGYERQRFNRLNWRNALQGVESADQEEKQVSIA